jgi:pimeloyl-ACP methyl ester carboxylesterase
LNGQVGLFYRLGVSIQVEREDSISLNTGVVLNYRAWGRDGQPMVLIHGLASTMRIWDLAAPLLARKFCVTAYDQRGHALSDKPPEGYDLPGMLADLRGLIEALGLERPVLVGHSWGAYLALAYAATYPDECSGVALVDGGVMSLRDRPGSTWESVSHDLAPPDLSRYKMSDTLEWARTGALGHLPESFLKEFYGSMLAEQPDGTIRARLSRENHMKILRIMWDMDIEGLLSKVRCPLLVVMAEGANPDERQAGFIKFRRRGVALAKKLVHDTKVVWMKDTIHDIPLQRPERLAEKIISFFS